MENKNLNESNIFEDFTNNSDLKKEVKKFEKEKNKDIFFYISKASVTFSYLNLLLFLILIVLFSYNFIQRNEDLKDSSWLDPFCNLILGDIPIPDGTTYCSSITFTKSYYDKILKKTEIDLFNSLHPVVSQFLQKQDFKNNIAVNFMAARTENRMKPLEIINEFDKLKNSYELESMLPLIRLSRGSKALNTSIEDFDISNLKIICNSISISNDYLVEVSCQASTSGWDQSILGLTGKRQYESNGNGIEQDKDAIAGSINTLLASFVNYIEINSDIFSIEDKSYSYDIGNILGSIDLKAQFNLKLKYNKALQADSLIF